jgi:hypothetical protein
MTDPRRPNQLLDEPFYLRHEFAANADGGTVTTKLHKFSRRCKITKARVHTVAGLAEHGTNVVVLSVKNGATTVASHSTDSDLMATDAGLPADDFLDLTLATDEADRIFEAGDVLSFVNAEAGTTNVPAGAVTVEGRYL